MSTKRQNVESKLGNHPKRFNAGLISNQMATSPSPPQSAYANSLSQYYNFSSPPPDQRFSGLQMMSLMDPSAYSVYGAQNWQTYATQSSQSAVVFDPSQPPPPLPPDIKRPKPPPPETPPPSTPAPPRPPPPMLVMGRRQMLRPPFPRGPLMERVGLKRPMYPVRHFSPTHPMGVPIKTLQKPVHRPDGTNSVQSEVIDADAHDDNHIQINKKSKRKPMSTRYTRKREWDRDDALKAIALENEFNRLQKTPMLILKFPDPELNKDIVKQYSTMIETVHFQQPSTPRYCFIQLKEGADIDKVKEQISQIPFGMGKIIVEKKNQNAEENQVVSPEEIDPYTLYIGNLPTTISVSTVKEKFPTAHRIDIGYAQRMKYTRYAFIRYHTVEEAMDAYKKTFNLLIESRSLIVRFRRQKGNVGLPGEMKIQNPKKQPPAKQTEEDKDISSIKDSVIDTLSVEKNGSGTPDKTVNNIVSEDISKTSEDVDSKENVFADSQRLLSELNSTSNDISLTEIKRERDDDDSTQDDDDLAGNGILGTKVKDEPLDEEDEYLDDSNYYDDMDEEDECDLPPEDEDEIVDDEYNPNDEDKEEDDEDAEAYGRHHWEQVRQKELNTKEEKPDISLLPTFGLKKNDNYSSLLGPDNSQKDDDGLDELFNNMNPEDDESSTY